MSLTFISSEERAWNRLTLSKLPYSIEWNTKTRRVKVTAPFIGRNVICSLEAANANEALAVGEETLGRLGCKLSQGEFNARIPVITLGK